MHKHTYHYMTEREIWWPVNHNWISHFSRKPCSTSPLTGRRVTPSLLATAWYTTHMVIGIPLFSSRTFRCMYVDVREGRWLMYMLHGTWYYSCKNFKTLGEEQIDYDRQISLKVVLQYMAWEQSKHSSCSDKSLIHSIYTHKDNELYLGKWLLKRHEFSLHGGWVEAATR